MRYCGRKTNCRTNVDSRVFVLIMVRVHIHTTVLGGVVAVGCESDSFVAGSAAVEHAVARYSRCGC